MKFDEAFKSKRTKTRYMAYKLDAREKEIENRLRKDYFAAFDAEEVLGDVDFSVGIPQDELQMFEKEYLLWAEAKKSNHHDIYESLVQLILTIGKARTFDKHLPPAFLGAFDAEKIAFLPYHRIIDAFSLSYIDWTVRPSDHESPTFVTLLSLVKDTLEKETLIYDFSNDDRLLRTFIKRNFVSGKSRLSKVRINKTNFTAIFQKWLREVKPTIAVNWDVAKRKGIIAADFYLADILSEHNSTLRDKLYAVLRKDHYELDRQFDDSGFFNSKTAEFKDKQKAHIQFWNRYERPPRREYWDEIVERRDQLVPQDIREVKGSFFTPDKWVSLSQQYLNDEFGENWQQEYYIWDCAAGTGNLLANLTEPYNIWASTLDPQDVAVMHDRIKRMNDESSNGKGSNLLDTHVFQFDFLNDSFDKLPENLRDIINNEEKRKKLIIYINPPYAEASNKRTVSGSGSNRTGLSKTYVSEKYKKELRKAVNELYAHFLIRIYKEIPGAYIACFSSLKLVQASNFREFRKEFKARMCRAFVVPAKTFDNVKGSFPIGFYVWNTQDNEEVFNKFPADIYDKDETILGKKNIYSYQEEKLIIEWLRSYYDKKSKIVAFQMVIGTDVQHNTNVYISNWVRPNDIKKHMAAAITYKNLIPMTIYTTVRRVVEQSWINNQDQYLWPNDGWMKDKEFQSNCLTYCLFQNTIENKKDTFNHFIPFTEAEVNAQDNFKSHFMSDYIKGTIRKEFLEVNDPDIFDETAVNLQVIHQEPIVFSEAAQRVLDAGRDLFCYYHQQPQAQPDASFYDIRLHFQGTHKDNKGKDVMNSESNNAKYNELLKNLRQQLKELARQIVPKIYDYGFLKRNFDPLSQQQKLRPKHNEFKPPMDEEAEEPFNGNGAKLKGVSIEEINKDSQPVINITVENHFEGEIDNLTINK